MRLRRPLGAAEGGGEWRAVSQEKAESLLRGEGGV